MRSSDRGRRSSRPPPSRSTRSVPTGVAILNADDPDRDRVRRPVPRPGRHLRHPSPRRRARRGCVAGSRRSGSFRLVTAGSRPGDAGGARRAHGVERARRRRRGMRARCPRGRCARALADAGVSRWRMETFTTTAGVRVLNDAYNANPESTAAALRTARWMAGEERHRGARRDGGARSDLRGRARPRGELAARIRVDRLITVGGRPKRSRERRSAKAWSRRTWRPSTTPDEALEDVRRSARSGRPVLFKGSRVAGLETLAEALR